MLGIPNEESQTFRLNDCQILLMNMSFVIKLPEIQYNINRLMLIN